MNKVLIISYYFPPGLEVGGQRPYSLAKYFPSSGWEPIVLTAKLAGNPPKGMRVIETGFKDIIASYKGIIGFRSEKGLQEQLGFDVSRDFYRETLKSKILKRLKEIISYPDLARGWYQYALKAGLELVRKENIDLIISTSPPVTSHLIAKKIKEKNGIPWVADFRDLWMQNHYYDKSLIVKLFETRLESNTLAYTDLIVTVTEPWAEMIKNNHNDKPVICITNGYNPEEVSNGNNIIPHKLSITYTGILYYGKRDPSLFFKAISELINDNKVNKELIEVNFYCPKESWIFDYIKKYALEGIVKVHGLISREKVLKEQRKSQVLLLLLWDHSGEEKLYPAKVFEYLAARRPIIAVGGPKGLVNDLLEETDSGRFSNDLVRLKGIIEDYYQQFLTNGVIESKTNNNIAKYSYDSIAKKYAETLSRLLSEIHPHSGSQL